jgi:hypothetical protein
MISYGEMPKDSEIPSNNTFTNLIKQMYDSTLVTIHALAYLQKSGLCCNKIAVLTKHGKSPILIFAISFGEILTYISNLQSIHDVSRGMEEWSWSDHLREACRKCLEAIPAGC